MVRKYVRHRSRAFGPFLTSSFLGVGERWPSVMVSDAETPESLTCGVCMGRIIAGFPLHMPIRSYCLCGTFSTPPGLSCCTRRNARHVPKVPSPSAPGPLSPRMKGLRQQYGPSPSHPYIVARDPATAGTRLAASGTIIPWDASARRSSVATVATGAPCGRVDWRGSDCCGRGRAWVAGPNA